jgi:hypothetical protein
LKDTPAGLQRGGFGPKATPRQPRTPQAITSVGGTLCRGEGAQARHIQASERGRRRTHQCLEHPAAKSLLPLARISKFFPLVNRRAQHPSWRRKCKQQQFNKKGNSAFPKKPSHPRGLLRGAFPPPPKKMVPFFRKKPTCAKYDSTGATGKIKKRRGRPSGKGAQARDSLCLHEDTTLLSCPRPSRLFAKIELP